LAWDEQVVQIHEAQVEIAAVTPVLAELRQFDITAAR
jgi:hypothetical protein